MSVYDYKVNTLRGQEIEMSQYRGKVLLIVNTASQCGLTPQFKGLQELQDQFQNAPFEVLGFPSNQFAQEKGSSDDIAEFCQMNYGVSFPMFEKLTLTVPVLTRYSSILRRKHQVCSAPRPSNGTSPSSLSIRKGTL